MKSERKKIDCILLIDDNADDNTYNQIIIEKMNIADNIKIAENGIDALSYLEEGQKAPDLILLDMNMPKMNGWEFLDLYRAYSAKKSLSSNVIVLADSLSIEDQESWKAFRLLHPNFKPLTKQMLEEITNQHLQNSGGNGQPENSDSVS